jgi:hypothetical protein
VEQRVVPALRIGKEVDVGGHVVVDHQRQIGTGRGQVGLGLGHNIRIDHEGHVAGRLARRRLLLRDKAVALLQGLHLQPVHPVQNAVELLLQLGIAADVDAAHQHQVHGAIELLLGLGQLSLAIVGIAARVGALHLLNQQPHPLLLQGQRLRRESRGSRGLPGSGGQRGRGGLRLLGRRRLRGLMGNATSQQKSRHSQTRQIKMT